MPYASVRDLEMYYEEFGRGQALLFLHSHYSRGLLAFSGQILPFSKRYRCLFPDFRGHGRTRCEDLRWSSRRIADDMPLLLDALGIAQAHVVGYSCGAYVGCYLASKYPDRVKSLVTIGGAAYPHSEGCEDYLPEALLRHNDLDFIETARTRHLDAHRGDWQTYLTMTVEDWKNHPNLSEEEWKAIACPVLCVNGEHDPYGSCQELRQRLPEASVYQVKGGGHRPHFVGEQIDEVNARILDFLADVDLRRSKV